MFKGHAVADKLGCATVDFQHLGKREIFIPLSRRGYLAFNHIASAKPILFDLLMGHEDIVGRRHIVEIARTEESESLIVDFKHAAGLEKPLEFVAGHSCGSLTGKFLLFLVFLPPIPC